MNAKEQMLYIYIESSCDETDGSVVNACVLYKMRLCIRVCVCDRVCMRVCVNLNVNEYEAETEPRAIRCHK